MKTTCLPSILTLSVALSLTACNGDSANNATSQKPSKPTSPDSENTSLTDQYDREMIQQIAKAGKKIQEKQIWLDYGKWYQAAPIYMLRTQDKDSTQPLKAFAFNPISPSKDFQKLGNNEAFGLNVFRNDANIHLHNDKLNKGNGAFDFELGFEGTSYYAQKYHRLEMSPDHVDHGNKTIDRNLTLNIHENFHKYQGKHFKSPTSYVQDMVNYPVNQELIELKLHTLQIFQGLPKTLSSEEAKRILSQYVALTRKQIAIDTSEKKLVEHMGLWQELYEGTARYVEVLAQRELFSHTKETSFVYDWFLKAEYTTAKDVHSEFSFGIFYQTGASATWLLKQAGYDLKKLEQGISPYHAAISLLDANTDYDAILNQLITTAPNAALIKQKAQRWSEL